MKTMNTAVKGMVVRVFFFNVHGFHTYLCGSSSGRKGSERGTRRVSGYSDLFFAFYLVVPFYVWRKALTSGTD